MSAPAASVLARLTRPVGRKEWVDFAKGVAIVMVVVYHVSLFTTSAGWDLAGGGRLKAALGLFPMPMFLFIAGLHHFRVVTWTLAQTWQRRLLGYLYLYLLWSVIRFAFYLVVPNVRSDGAGASATDPVALATVLVWPVSSYWFLLALLVFTLVLQLVRAVPRVPVLVVAAALSVLFGARLVSTTNVGWDRMGEYLVFFLAGAFYSRQLFAWIGRARWWALAGALVLLVGTVGVAALVPGGARAPGVSFIGESAAVVAGALASVRLIRLRPLAFVGRLGARSLQLYLMHIFVIALLLAAVTAVPGHARLPGTLVLVGCSVVVIVMTGLLSRLLDRFTWLFVPPRALARLARPRSVVAAPRPSAMP